MTRPGVVHLHIDAPIPGISLDGAAVCPAPCDREIDGQGRARFFFRGPGIPSSPRFDLSAMSGPVTARVNPGSPRVSVAGFVLLGLGLYGLVSAIQSVVVGAIVSEVTGASRDADPFYLSAAVSTGAGAALIGLGAWLAAGNQTTFELLPARPAKKAEAAPSR